MVITEVLARRRASRPAATLEVCTVEQAMVGTARVVERTERAGGGLRRVGRGRGRAGRGTLAAMLALTGAPLALVVADAAPAAAAGEAPLKVCNVAGPGVDVGRRFEFKVAGVVKRIPAGAGGGTCRVFGSFPLGSEVTVDQQVEDATQVAIAVAPASSLVGTPNPTVGTATVTIEPGGTMVTYTNRAVEEYGFINICKASTGGPSLPGLFYFMTSDGASIGLRDGQCLTGSSGGVRVPAGTFTLEEVRRPRIVLDSCRTAPRLALISCDPDSSSATFTVRAAASPTDSSTNTKITMVNRRP